MTMRGKASYSPTVSDSLLSQPCLLPLANKEPDGSRKRSGGRFFLPIMGSLFLQSGDNPMPRHREVLPGMGVPAKAPCPHSLHCQELAGWPTVPSLPCLPSISLCWMVSWGALTSPHWWHWAAAIFIGGSLPTALPPPPITGSVAPPPTCPYRLG